MRDERCNVDGAGFQQPQGVKICEGTPGGIVTARCASRRHQHGLAKLYLIHDAEVHSPVAVAIQQHGGLLANETRNSVEDLARSGRLDEEFHAHAARMVAHLHHDVGRTWINGNRAPSPSEVALVPIGLAHHDQAIESLDVPEVLEEQQAGRTAAADEYRSHRAVAGSIAQTEASTRAVHHRHRMQDTTEWLRECRVLGLDVKQQGNGVDSGDRHELGKSTRQSRNAVFAIVIALM